MTMWVSAALPLLAALLLPPPFCRAQTGIAKPPHPHIIFILADDMGFHDAPWHNPLVHAPALTGLAEGGITLEQSYMMPVCSPSRASLLSGKYPHTSGMMYKSIKPLQPTGLPLNLTLLPQTLKGLGYTTHAIGKWHLGFCKDEYTPLRRGFDTFRGFYTGSLDYYSHSRGGKKGSYKRSSGNHGSGKQNGSNSTADSTYNKNLLKKKHLISEDEAEKKKSHDKVNGFDFRDNDAPDDSKLGQYSTFQFVRNAQTLLQNRDPRVPMFMYLAFQNPHGPLQVPRKYLNLYPHEANPKRKVFMGMLSALDDAVQRVLDTLKETGHYENSIIVFSSDNGGSVRKMGLNWPLRGTKGSLFEGGTRIPALISGPLIRQHGTTYQGIFHATDWYPTLVSAAGSEPPIGLDGIDQWRALQGLRSAPRKQMIYQMVSDHGLKMAMRFENYKVLLGNFPDRGWFVPPEFQNIDKEVLTNFLDTGKAMNIAPYRPDSEYQNDNSSFSDSLSYSNSSDMVTAENPDNDDYYSDGDNDENSEEVGEELSTSEKNPQETVSSLGLAPHEGNRSDNRRVGSRGSSGARSHQMADEGDADSVRLMQEMLAGAFTAQDDKNSVSNGLLEMHKHDRRTLKKDRKQQRQGVKEQRKRSKLERKVQKRLQKKIRPMELAPEDIQRVVGIKKRTIDSFDSVESILVSGIPIHLYDLKKDPYERHNIAAIEPEVLESLLHRLLPEIKGYTPPYNPPLSLKGLPSNFGGFWSSGWC